ncbi:D-aminopeptidase [uncultured archaeon]|nr:D-aminopeptidase [uncultured archaeon]
MVQKLMRLILACALCLSLSGCCQGASLSGNEAGSKVMMQEPDEAKLKEILQDFEQYAEEGMKDWQVPGMAIAIVRDNETIYQKAFGVRKVNGTDKVTNNTLFQIGSTTKAFTAALVGMMVDEGKMKWNDKVIDHLPDFRMRDPWVTREFTITDLMAHRSGLPEYSGADLVTLGYGRDYLMQSLRNTEPVTSFRSTYAYQNTLFLVAAALVENETGKSWEDNIRGRIFQPLEMSNSSVDMRSFQQAKDVAYLHQMRNGTVTALPMDWKYMDWVYVYGPAGGINSNIIDMTKWLRLQMNNGSFEGKQIISKNGTIYMHTPQTVIGAMPSGNSVFYCQGWLYQESRPYNIIWHNGGTLSHKTMVAFVPQAKIGIVILSNIFTDLPDMLAFQFFDMYFGNPNRDYSALALNQTKMADAQLNLIMPEQPEKPSPPLPLEKYVGNYSNLTYGSINITQENGSLVVLAGPRHVKMTLIPWDRDTFRTYETDFRDQKGFAIFMIGPEGRAERILMGGGVLFSQAQFDLQAS